LREQAAAIAAQRGAYAGYLVDASFTRLRDVAVTYTLPDGVTSLVHLRHATITMSGMNLHVWTKYVGGDPEESGGTGSIPNFGAYAPGTALVPPRTWVIRTNLTF
jgi:hypothetical protein